MFRHVPSRDTSDSDEKSGVTPRGSRNRKARHRKHVAVKPQRPRRWSDDVVPLALDQLREHPVFSLENHLDGDLPNRMPPGVVSSQSLTEADREPLYQIELLRIFRSRIFLVSCLGIGFLPLFAAFYFYLAPRTAVHVLSTYAALVAVLLGCIALSGAMPTLRAMRALSMSGYLAFCVGAASVISLVSRATSIHGEASRNVQFVVLASFVHILLSVLLLPFSLVEATCVVAFVLTAMAWGLDSAALTDGRIAFYSQLFVFATTATLILTISHLGSILRRSAFDASFNLAMQAARMREMSATDPLTSGFNRRYIENLLSLEVPRAARFSHSLSLIMFDLDNFKPVNDSLGHGAGDEVLREVWRAAGAALREVDTMARFGGDEYLIVLPETGPHSAKNIAERLRAVVGAQLRERWGAHSLEGEITLSMGVLTLDDEEALPVSEAIARVDALLYEAKRSGKNRTATA